ncbi:phage gp6-like head-tail connector protein [Paenibacillus whitsoniae]|uniref:Phage gp6-like head-tail connector protein n=2 Tax=Paenibacillus whitsoniae TaxID=2496558 RepID=A0A430J7H2_9BACL|nr:phage gp6-like head-tail connector protein [Paenibacillus whitsoniae]
MTDDELLEKVKRGLSVSGSFNDTTLRIKVLAVKQYMLNAGITQEIMESELGVATLTIGVTDLWNLTSGEIKFSPAFSECLMPQLMVVSLPDVSS